MITRKQLLDKISNDLQILVEDNEILRAEIEDYFAEKRYEK
jgi:cell division septum initiation protein DivIVA